MKIWFQRYLDNKRPILVFSVLPYSICCRLVSVFDCKNILLEVLCMVLKSVPCLNCFRIIMIRREEFSSKQNCSLSQIAFLKGQKTVRLDKEEIVQPSGLSLSEFSTSETCSRSRNDIRPVRGHRFIEFGKFYL